MPSTATAVVGPPGIGKSRLARELSAMAASRGVDVFTTFCESHTSHIPFHAVARLLRAAIGVEGHDAQAARDQLRERSLMPTRRTCCYWMTCWASAILMLFCLGSTRMLVGGG